MHLNALCETVHAANIKWWQDVETGQPIRRNKGELLALIHSEISECHEGQVHNLMDDKLPHRRMGEVELVDAVIRIFDYARGFDHDLGSAARRVGVIEFNDLNHFCNVFHFATLTSTSLIGIHAKISFILELERKARPSELVADAIIECLIEIFAYARHCKYDMQGAFDEKMTFNAQREDHKHEARRIAGGKQF